MHELLKNGFTSVVSFKADDPLGGGGGGTPGGEGDTGDKSKIEGGSSSGGETPKGFGFDGGEGFQIQADTEENFQKMMDAKIKEAAGVKPGGGAVDDGDVKYYYDGKLFSAKTQKELMAKMVEYEKQKSAGGAGAEPDDDGDDDIASFYEELTSGGDRGYDNSRFGQIYGQAQDQMSITGGRDLTADFKPDYSIKPDLSDFEEKFGKEDSLMASTLAQRWNKAYAEVMEKQQQQFFHALEMKMGLEYISAETTQQEQQLEEMVKADKRSLKQVMPKILAYIRKHDRNGVVFEERVKNPYTGQMGRALYRSGILTEAYKKIYQKQAESNKGGQNIKDILGKFKLGTPGGGAGGGGGQNLEQVTKQVIELIKSYIPGDHEKGLELARKHGIKVS